MAHTTPPFTKAIETDTDCLPNIFSSLFHAINDVFFFYLIAGIQTIDQHEPCVWKSDQFNPKSRYGVMDGGEENVFNEQPKLRL